MKKRSFGQILKMTLIVILYKIFLYGMISLFFIGLFSWADIIKFDFRYVIVLTAVFLGLWLSFGKYFMELDSLFKKNKNN